MSTKGLFSMNMLVLIFEFPAKEAEAFVQLDLIPGWRSKMSKVLSFSWTETYLRQNNVPSLLLDMPTKQKLYDSPHNFFSAFTKSFDQVKKPNGELRSITSFLSPDSIVVRLVECHYAPSPSHHIWSCPHVSSFHQNILACRHIVYICLFTILSY